MDEYGLKGQGGGASRPALRPRDAGAVAQAELLRKAGRQFDPAGVPGAIDVFGTQRRVGGRWPIRQPTYVGGGGG
jgi:hypothetical protein